MKNSFTREATLKNKWLVKNYYELCQTDPNRHHCDLCDFASVVAITVGTKFRELGETTMWYGLIWFYILILTLTLPHSISYHPSRPYLATIFGPGVPHYHFGIFTSHHTLIPLIFFPLQLKTGT